MKKNLSGAIINELYFFYDSYGNLSYIKYYKNNGADVENYIVLTNSRGDVTGLYTTAGNLAVSYEYDAWGNLVYIKGSGDTLLTPEANPDHIGIVNPIRYRGYYYNTETKLYYLQSRFYDAEIGRFINADGYITTGQGVLSYNMFAYCKNNPVMFSDPSGEISLLVFSCAAIIAIINVAAIFLSEKKDSYIAPKGAEVLDTLASEGAKTPVVKSAGSFGGAFLGVCGGAQSVRAFGKAMYQKKETITQITKDAYNTAYYSSLGGTYTPSSSSSEIFSSEEYAALCQKTVPAYLQTFEYASYIYSDIGTVSWDNLGEDSKGYLLGEFKRIHKEEYIQISTYYGAKGAIVP